MARLTGLIGLHDTRVHDMRKVIATWLREEHLALPFVLDAILHHAPRGTTDQSYNFAVLEQPVRQALQAWSDHVARITTEKSNVG